MNRCFGQIFGRRFASSAQTSLVSELNSELDAIRQAGTFKNERVIVGKQDMVIQVEGQSKPLLNFCANNYLGLSSNLEVIEAGKKYLDSHGAGLSSVRFICGTQDIHRKLEKKLAEFHQREDAILYAACFDANAGIFEVLTKKMPQFPNTTKASEFTFSLLGSDLAYNRNVIGRTIKIYITNIQEGNQVRFMDIFNGNSRTFLADLDEYHGKCMKSHKCSNIPKHSPIIRLEFEQLADYPFDGIVLFVVCQEGLYLSTGTLNIENNTLKIDPNNLIKLTVIKTWNIQLLMFSEDIGLVVYREDRDEPSGPSKIKFQTFRIMKTSANDNPIELLGNNELRSYLSPVLPYVRNGHAYFLAYFILDFSGLVDLDYLKCTFEIEKKATPRVKDGMQGVWHEDKFYYLAKVNHPQYKPGNLYFDFGVFCLETRKFAFLKLPQNIPGEWMHWMQRRSGSQTLITIDERAILNFMPIDNPIEFKGNKRIMHDAKVVLFRIPLRVPEMLSNLTYFSFLNKSPEFQKKFQYLIDGIYSKAGML